MEISGNILTAFLLTLFAGLSTGIGSAIAFFTKRTNTKLLSVALGFSAGVMIYISFMEIFPHAQEILIGKLGKLRGHWYSLLAFFGGMLLITFIDKFIPSFENPHELKAVEDMDDKSKAIAFRKLYRMGIMTALAVGIHNFPEGLATFASALEDPSIGIAIAIAIAIHNIPEGIAVSVPVYYATGNRRKAFWLSFLSGVSEPVGALLGYLLIMPFVTPENMDLIFAYILAGVAGIMIFISFDELLPSAEEYGEHHLSVYGLIGGMAVMALSLMVLS
ncbi:zinc transporter ZupT [Prolixibacter denitrificans]|uniref:Zinc transporter ZupT n=1 Tax=Prolixibacter denitrificans TaxID=1541063 RepID=A0A2P8CBM9_9BACT|nr:zinc transporter ZupT [Prolixibacter denitrificans]PSK82378.1 ZIP family zinc transporter [Prolixibacter denitrificans]GET22876.1 zinc transporter ZupT [Prolixibacter denitrificans]